MCIHCDAAAGNAQAQEVLGAATSGAAIRAKMEAVQDEAQMPHADVRSPAEYERRIAGLQRENERLAQQARLTEEISEGRRVMAVKYKQEAHDLRAELHEAKLAASAAMNFAILLAKSIK